MGTPSVLTPFLWMLHVVNRLVFNDCVVGEGLGDSWYRTLKGRIVPSLLFLCVV